MAYITEAQFEAITGLVVSATTSPTSTEFAEWITYVTGWINEFICHTTSDVTDTNSQLLLKSASLLKEMWINYYTSMNEELLGQGTIPALGAFGTHADDSILRWHYRDLQFSVHSMRNGRRVF